MPGVLGHLVGVLGMQCRGCLGQPAVGAGNTVLVTASRCWGHSARGASYSAGVGDRQPRVLGHSG